MTNEIINTKDFNKIKEEILKGDEKSLILLDIDDTIITPKSGMFRPHSKHYHFIDKIKANIEEVPNYAEILSVWRQNRKLMLVHNNWPAFVRDRKFEGHNIFALTQMRPGKFGSIENMEKWRYEELESLNIHFVEKFNREDNIEILPETAFKEHSGLMSPAVFYKGFFMTGGHSKGAVVRYILDHHYPSKIFFVDDREDHVKDVSRVAEEFGIPYQGFVYRGIDLLDAKMSDDIHDFQKKMLLEELRWIEDDEAQEMIRNGW